MKKIILTSLIIGSSLFGQVNAPDVLTDNDFETAEYQLFVTNTKNIKITTDLNKKIVYEGEIEDYYKNVNKVNSQKYSFSEESIKHAIDIHSNKLGNAIYYNDIKTLKDIGVMSLGAAALKAMLNGLMDDDIYVQVADYYKNDKPVTRVIKYVVSDDNLDEEEMKLVFNTTSNQSYHFRSGGFQSVRFK